MKENDPFTIILLTPFRCSKKIKRKKLKYNIKKLKRSLQRRISQNPHQIKQISQSNNKAILNNKTVQHYPILQSFAIPSATMPSSATQAGISIKIGDVSDTTQKQISKIQIKAHTLKSQIADFEDNLKTKLGISKVPIIMAVLPDYFPVEKVMEFNDLWENAVRNQVTQKISKDGANFYLTDFKDPNDKDRLFIKKLSKVFAQLNTTKKEVSAEIKFYGIGQRMQKCKAEHKPLAPWSILFDSCFVRTWVDLSQQFWDMFLTLAQKISPKFANSPLMAVLPLMEKVSLNLTLDSVNKFDNITTMFIGQADEKMYQKAMEKRDKMKIYVSFEELGYLEIIVDVEILAVAQFSQTKN